MADDLYGSVILFRRGYDDPAEEQIAREHFPMSVFRYVSDLPSKHLVVGRYSVLPFYEEVEHDIEARGCKLINSYRQHRYLAELGSWYRDLQGITPETWAHLDAVPDDAWPCVIKGATNSKKNQWSTHMFARDRQAAVEVVTRLAQDGLIASQSLYFRRFEPLVQVADNIAGGAPVSKEFRVFICDEWILAKGFYWSSHADVAQPTPDVREIPVSLVRDVMDRVGLNARFYTADIAQTQAGRWIVVELNDGQMSGLSECDPHDLYRSLHAVVG